MNTTLLEALGRLADALKERDEAWAACQALKIGSPERERARDEWIYCMQSVCAVAASVVEASK